MKLSFTVLSVVPASGRSAQLQNTPVSDLKWPLNEPTAASVEGKAEPA